MLSIRRNNERGNTQRDWLNSFHTFSFGEYYDPKFIHFGNLRVINEDTIQASGGFGRHSHENMEIISYVVEGSLKHKDSMGTQSVIKPGEIQRMSAGYGVEHSEFNDSSTDPLHFLQIWILPEKLGLEPSYEQKSISKSDNQLILIGSHQPSTAAITIHQDVELYVAYLTQGSILEHHFKNDRKAWLQLVKGEVEINGHTVFCGDGVAIVDEGKIKIQCLKDAELLLFDLSDSQSS